MYTLTTCMPDNFMTQKDMKSHQNIAKPEYKKKMSRKAVSF